MDTKICPKCGQSDDVIVTRCYAGCTRCGHRFAFTNVVLVAMRTPGSAWFDAPEAEQLRNRL